MNKIKKCNNRNPYPDENGVCPEEKRYMRDNCCYKTKSITKRMNKKSTNSISQKSTKSPSHKNTNSISHKNTNSTSHKNNTNSTSHKNTIRKCNNRNPYPDEKGDCPEDKPYMRDNCCYKTKGPKGIKTRKVITKESRNGLGNVWKKVTKKNNFTKSLSQLNFLNKSFLILDNATTRNYMKLFKLEKDNYLYAPKLLSFDNYTSYKEIDSGSYNKIYRLTGKFNKNYAFRVELTNSKIAIKRFKKDALLYVRLSALKIIPKLHDIFYGKTGKGETALCSISDLAEGGSVTKYFRSDSYEKLNDENVKEFAIKLRNLYRRLVENLIFCTDVKTHNAVVSFENGMPIPYLIDFDTEFCSAKESFINIESSLKKINNILETSITRKELLDIYFNFMILQVACVIRGYTGAEYHKVYLETFIGEIINKKMLRIMSKLITLKIGNGNIRPIDMLENYFILSKGNAELQKKLRDDPLEFLKIAYTYAKYGEKITKEHFNHIAL
jgi:hypothetical protein